MGGGAASGASPAQRRQPQFLRQIAPIGVRRLNQFDLPLALPILDLLLTRDRGVHRPGEFEPDERFDAIAFGEAVEAAVAMLDDAPDQVRGDAGVECAVARAHAVRRSRQIWCHYTRHCHRPW